MYSPKVLTKMRIIYYSPHPTHDIVSEVGYATHQREVILALKALGHDVLPVIMGGTDASTLSPLAKGSYQPSKIKALLKKIVPSVLWTSFNNYKLRIHDKRAGNILRNAINDFKPELIYERSEYLQDSGAKAAKEYGIQYFLEVNAPFVEEMRAFEGYSLYQSKAHAIEKYKLKIANKVFAVSTALSDFMIQRYQCQKDKIFVQPNCINPSKLKITNDEVSILKQSLSLENCQVIGFVGSMFPYHGVDILIAAFAKVYIKHSKTRLLIVGDGSILSDLKRQVSQLGIENAVIFTGKVEHQYVFNYISLMDICIMAKSNWYGSPVKLFEYGLMRKPIIAPDTAPVKDVMVHEQDALIIPDNENALSDAIENLINKPEKGEAMANSFYNKVMSSYNWEHAAKNIIKQCK